jgi:hypothetical protein
VARSVDYMIIGTHCDQGPPAQIYAHVQMAAPRRAVGILDRMDWGGGGRGYKSHTYISWLIAISSDDVQSLPLRCFFLITEGHPTLVRIVFPWGTGMIGRFAAP